MSEKPRSRTGKSNELAIRKKIEFHKIEKGSKVRNRSPLHLFLKPNQFTENKLPLKFNLKLIQILIQVDHFPDFFFFYHRFRLKCFAEFKANSKTLKLSVSSALCNLKTKFQILNGIVKRFNAT